MIRIHGPRNRDWSEINFHDGRYHRKHSPEPFMVESCTLHEAINQYCKKYKVSIKKEMYLGELKLVHKTLKKKNPVCDSVEIIVARDKGELAPECWESFNLEDGDTVEIKQKF